MQEVTLEYGEGKATCRNLPTLSDLDMEVQVEATLDSDRMVVLDEPPTNRIPPAGLGTITGPQIGNGSPGPLTHLLVLMSKYSVVEMHTDK